VRINKSNDPEKDVENLLPHRKSTSSIPTMRKRWSKLDPSLRAHVPLQNKIKTFRQYSEKGLLETLDREKTVKPENAIALQNRVF
jgi:hypothetical protein